MADLLTVNEYKTAVSIPLSETGQDAKIAQAVTWASTATRNYTGRDFATAEDLAATTRRYRYDGSGFLQVDDLVTGSVEGIAVDGLDLPADTYLVEPSDPNFPVQFWIELPPGYGISPEMGFMRNLDRLSEFRRQRFSFVDVTARFGWAEVPGDVKQAMVWITASFLDNPRPVVSKSVADVSYTYPNPNNDLIPDRAKLALDYYAGARLGAA